MDRTRNGKNALGRQIKSLRRKFDRARVSLGEALDGRKYSKLRQEVNDIAHQLGWALTDDRQYDEALVVFETLDPETHGEERLTGISRVFIERERFDEARQVLDEAIEQYPESYCLLNSMGLFHYKTEDSYEALRWFDKALRHDSGDENHTAAKNRGLALIDLGLYNDAAVVYERLLDDDEDNTEYLYQLAFCNLSRENLWDAIRLYQACLVLGYEAPGVYAGLCTAFGKAGFLAEALAVGLNGLEVYPEIEAMYENLGEVYLDMGEHDDAEDLLTKGAERFPDSEAIHALLDRLEQEKEGPKDDSGSDERSRAGEEPNGERQKTTGNSDEALRKLLDGGDRGWN